MRKYKLILLSLATAAFANVNDGTTETPVAEAPAQVEATAQPAAPAAAEAPAPAATETQVQEQPQASAPIIIIPAQKPAPEPVQAEATEPAPAPTAVLIQEKPLVVKPAKSPNRGAFFFSTNFGVRYMRLAYQSLDDIESLSKDNATTSKCSGFGPDLGLKIGGVIAGRLAMYFTMEFATLDGTFEATNVKLQYNEPSKDVEFNTDAIRFTLGGGTALFLSSDTASALYGTFVGVSASLFVGEAGKINPDNEELEIDETGLAFAMEIGKVWRLSENWNAGIVAKGSLDGTVRDGTSGNNTDCFTIGLSLVALRR